MERRIISSHSINSASGIIDIIKEQLMDPPVIREANKIEFVDTLDIPESKEEVIIPYLTGLYKDLLLRSDEPTKGIPRVILIDVFIWLNVVS